MSLRVQRGNLVAMLSGLAYRIGTTTRLPRRPGCSFAHAAPRNDTFLYSYFLSSVVSLSTKAMPHFGQVPGLSKVRSGCMVQVYLPFFFAVAVLSVLPVLLTVLLQALSAKPAKAKMIKLFFIDYLFLMNEANPNSDTTSTP